MDYNKINKLINQGQFDQAEKEIRKIKEETKKNNFFGLLNYHNNKFEIARNYFEKGLERNPMDMELLYNYGCCLKDLGEDMEAWRYFMRISNKDYKVYDHLGDIEYQNRSKVAAIKFYKKAFELSQFKEIETKYNEVRNLMKKNTKIVFLTVPGIGWGFIDNKVEALSLIYDVKFVVSTDGEEIKEAVEWADIVWLEWANEMAVHVTNNVSSIKDKKVICRLHGYEVFSDYGKKINFNYIDKMIFVAEHKKELLIEKYGELIDEEKIEVIRNGVDLDQFYIPENKKKNKKIALVGNINYRKGLLLLLNHFHELLKVDNEYKLFIRGEHQDFRYKMAIETMIEELGLEDNIEFIFERVDDINKWLEDKSYIISASVEESFHYALAEGMAAGLQPVIHAWRESRDIWPGKYIFKETEEFKKLFLERELTPLEYREYIENNYSLENQLYEVEKIISKLLETKTTKGIKQDYNSLNKVNRTDAVQLINNFIPYSEQFFSNISFDKLNLVTLKAEKIQEKLFHLEMLLANKNNNIFIQNVIFNKNVNSLQIPNNYKKIKPLIKKIVNGLDFNFEQDIKTYIYDEDLKNHIESNFKNYLWERAYPGTQFMRFHGELRIVCYYTFAEDLVKNKKVLEAASGFGYGAAYFSKYAKEVTALDILEENLDWGKKTFGFNNVNWKQGDVTNLPFEDNSFDIYTSYETIEHLKSKDIISYLKEAKRVVKDKGIFLLSTPNKRVREGKIDNPFHISEMYFKEFNEFLQEVFEEIEYYSYQEFKIHPGVKENSAENFIAICKV